MHFQINGIYIRPVPPLRYPTARPHQHRSTRKKQRENYLIEDGNRNAVPIGTVLLNVPGASKFEENAFSLRFEITASIYYGQQAPYTYELSVSVAINVCKAKRIECRTNMNTLEWIIFWFWICDCVFVRVKENGTWLMSFGCKRVFQFLGIDDVNALVSWVRTFGWKY